ncbi:MAG TPA: hypothetical protein VFA20_13975 [Myxococcaceae bacterium]|nr:hypothetical protein [Myxococcaceae bacterium]
MPLKQKAEVKGYALTASGGQAGWWGTSTFHSLPIAQRRKLMRSSAVEDPLRDAFSMALGPESELRSEALAIALRRIRAGDLRFSFVLGGFSEDRRVRKVALEALPRATGQDLVHLIKALSKMGGPGALDVLRRRFRQALRQRDDVARVLAGALLRLDPQAKDAARFLASLLRSRDWRIRQPAASALRHSLNPHLKTEAMALLEAPIRQVLRERDWEAAFSMADAIWILAPDPFRRMCLQGIAKRKRRAPWAGVGAGELIRHDGPRHLAEILDWIRHRASADDSLVTAWQLGSALPESELLRLTKAGLSHSNPYIRWLTIGLLNTQSPQSVARVRRFITSALSDEPEEDLRLQLQPLLKKS